MNQTNKIFWILFIFSAFFTNLFFISIVNAHPPIVTDSTKVLAHFDEGFFLDHAINTSISTNGTPQIYEDGKWGKCLRLGVGDYITFEAANNIGNFSEGTIMFWVRPHWNNNENISHTFCGMLVNSSGVGGYQIMTDGWWEPNYSNRLNFIANNQFGLGISVHDEVTPLLEGEWYHMAMIFKFDGDNSFTKIYVNGELLNQDIYHSYHEPGICNPQSEFMIGSSIFVDPSNERWANADFDEFVIFNKAFSHAELSAEYQTQNRKQISATFDSGILELKEGVDKTVTAFGNPLIIEDGIIGKCLSLNEGDYVTINTAENIGDFKEGTIMFWVRPHWNNNQNISHTFCGMQLNNDGTDGYMVMTDGWWESGGGSNRFYFIANNQFSLRSEINDIDMPLFQNQWYHMAMTFEFDGEDNSFTKMYVNGEMVGFDTQPNINVPGICGVRSELRIGTGLNIVDGIERWADADFDEFHFLNSVMLSDEIKNVYELEKMNSLKIKANFENDAIIDSANDTESISVIDDPAFTPCGIFSGRCLKLNQNDYLSINPANNIEGFNEGTVMFWIRPHWNNNENLSHSFFGMQLFNEGNNGYMVMTDGWWEAGGGEDRFYFIANNQFALRAEIDDINMPLSQNEWYHMAMTFKFDGANNSFSDMYLNGELVASDTQYASIIPSVCRPRSDLKIGSSVSIIDGLPRWADADFTRFRFLTRALEENQIYTFFREGSEYRRMYHDIYALADRPYTPLRDSQNKILETRILYEESAFWRDKEEAVRLVDRAKAAGFNTIMTSIFHGYGSRWHTNTIPIQPGYEILIEGEEPFRHFLNYAHSNNIDVHVSFTMNVCAYNNELVNFYRSNGWIDDSFKDDAGKHIIIVHNPYFKEFFSDLVKEVVAKFDVDGINLDYIRARCWFPNDNPLNGWWTDAYCQNNYAELHPQRSLIADIENKEYGYLGEWNYSAVTNIVKRVASKSRCVDPDVIISVCGYLLLDSELSGEWFATQGRNGKAWANSGLIDLALNMDYGIRPGYEHFKQCLDEFENPEKAVMFIGGYDRISSSEHAPRDPEYTATLMKFAQRLSADTRAVAYYDYRYYLTDEQIEALRKFAFIEEAVPIRKNFTKSIDIDGNGLTDLGDVITALKIVSNIDVTSISANSDLNCDGTVGIKDAIYVLRIISGLR